MNAPQKKSSIKVMFTLLIFDALFASMVSWLEGNSVDQVLFTCLYLHAPAKIEDKALRSFGHANRRQGRQLVDC
uniref:NAA35-like N-terminal domain-containing protein n=1 Tax=Glossina palpalis gambiensis TaxID=67801 RepID=A0A1B0C6Q7_9MUSC